MSDGPKPSLSLISSSSPARPVPTSPSSSYRQSESPFRYVHFPSTETDEKATPLTDYPTLSRQPSSSGRRQHQNSPLILASASTQRPTTPYTRPRGLRIFNLIKPWLPIILYGLTSLGFLIAIALYKTQVFARLDELSRWLRTDPQYGHAVLFILIFITTIPPIPLYSTLIILSGYTFGPWTGAVISYSSALTGAIVVFLISRTLFRDSIAEWLATTTTMKRIVRAIEKRPKLLFLIRLAPYPYNVMNCLLAAAPTLSFRTYTLCTALSLFKVIVHTSVGASIHSFKDYHVAPDKGTNAPSDADKVARMWTIIGIVLCAAIFIYLSVVARRAVDDELDDENTNTEESVGFLDPRGDIEAAAEMTESPLRAQHHQNVVR